MSSPDVSVVMGVYNGAEHLEQTLESVLSQEGCELEFIVVDDGSTDGTGRILDEWAARDGRLRVIHQENTGLTRALIRGCAEARGEFIARQDADDISLMGRLKEQSNYLRTHPDVVVVASAVRFIAPGSEWLYDLVPQEDIKIVLDIRQIKAPSLVGTLFRRDAYLRVGGFRKEFTVAQDVDLWLRLIEVGACKGIDSLHYQTKMTSGGISSRRRTEQIRAAQLAIRCAQLRRSGQDDQGCLEEEPQQHKQAGNPTTRQEKARFYYFIGACLSKHDPVAARRYFRQAVRENPLSLKALGRSILG